MIAAVPLHVLDSMTDPGAWAARTPDGAAASAELAVIADPANLTGDGSLRVTATTAALGHRLERTLPAADLTGFSDLQLVLRADRPADGSPAAPFFAELRLGSAAAPIGAGGNTWHRLLPVRSAGSFELVALALDDLPPAVRGAVTAVRLTVVDAARPVTLLLDRLAAVRESMLADADAALLARLDGLARIDDTPVPALVAEQGAADPQPPYIRLLNYDVVLAETRSQQAA